MRYVDNAVGMWGHYGSISASAHDHMHFESAFQSRVATEAREPLYRSLGFVTVSTATWYMLSRTG